MPKHFKKGFREKLLCTACEGLLSVWERYFHQLLVNKMNFIGRDSSIVAVANHLDYKQLKLLQMSLIWRAGISSRPEFKNIQLGPHAERLRKMIYENNPGEPYEYGCILIGTPSYFDLMSQMMMLGNESRFDGHKCYIFLLCGVSWVFIVSSHTNTLRMKEQLFLSKEGDLPIILDDKASKASFEKTVSEWKAMGILNQ
jgi:hypothetical protein